MSRRRIWSENLPLEALRRPRVLELLRRFELGVLVAVRPATLAELPATLGALASAGLEVGLWPMLDDARGRWASVHNAREFAQFAREVAGLAEGWRGELIVDLEPAIADVRAALRGPRGLARMLERAGDRASLSSARGVYASLARDLRGEGRQAVGVAVPLLLLDAARGPHRWEALLGVPLEGPDWGRVNVMMYTSILEGWSKGRLGRADALSLLGAACRATRARWGARAGVSLGAVGPGALRDEPVYRAPAELGEDVAAALACGIDELSLFDLTGVLARPPAEAWLEAFVATPASAAPPETTLRARAAVALGWGLGAAAWPGARLLAARGGLARGPRRVRPRVGGRPGV